MMIRFDQPLNSCGYWNNFCFCVTTTNQITILDQQNDQKLYQFQAIKMMNFMKITQLMLWLIMNLNILQEMARKYIKKMKNKRQLLYMDPILLNRLDILNNQRIVICYSVKNGLLEILKPQPYLYQPQSIEQEAQDLIEEEDNNKKQKKRG
ncbi:unnamed protein product (macronuclear) [Paramecium tetraurelia]|uniref:Chromosome undetermined scaffold_12, whole genome shotgun sequence n=1 Tax=Paramecium tetraurelia TaxID=5888 RepID=A0BPH7_PARTE|nr:uncharacterized protein GSPATT00005193001 [Paramecium tetraurelia]XP_001451064.1 uncharacterized protein GSPATT00039566001 [Paramecium tetraurelia]CAK60444.1 unnamed protein product [Paramecium tetraurelia]CAK83667.1 unnamed protein product [Paramecium tetraurelia]|eukprot:XP_001427842.1 hypothetical protein (macronuclear) [Paramecium tetraurelia strain d4-2]